MKIVSEVKKTFKVGPRPGTRIPPWVEINDCPNGVYPSVVTLNENITHWVEDGHVCEVKVVDRNSPKRGDQTLIPECEVNVWMSEVQRPDTATQRKWTPMELGGQMARRAHEKMEEHCLALVHAGCRNVFLFIITRPFIIEDGKGEPVCVLQFCVCGR